MPKIGRNTPCPCGSGKKYKHCHGPIDAQQEAEQRMLRNAQDTLLPKLMEAARDSTVAAAIPQALDRFWNSTHSVSDLPELDDLEDRGSDRFLTWFAFDYVLDDGQTLVERLVAEPADLELNPYEAQLLEQWQAVRLRPYSVVEVKKGQGLIVRDLLNDAQIEVEDHAAAKRILPNEIIVAHLVPAGTRHYVAGAAAQLTSDTREQLIEFIEMHHQAFQIVNTDDPVEGFVRAMSHIFNQFVMALPQEVGQPSKIEELLQAGRTSLLLAKASLGLHSSTADDASGNSQDETTQDEQTADGSQSSEARQDEES